MQGLSRPVELRSALPGGHVVARQHHDDRVVQVCRWLLIQNARGPGEGVPADVRPAQCLRMRGKVPQPDQAVRLAAAHRLVQAPQRTGTGVLLPAPEPDGDLRHEVREQRAGVRDLPVVVRVRVRRSVPDCAVDGLEQRHLNVVDGPARVDDLVPELQNLPPGGHGAAHERSPAMSVSNRLRWRSLDLSASRCAETTPRATLPIPRRARTSDVQATASGSPSGSSDDK